MYYRIHLHVCTYMCTLPQRSGGRRKRPHPDFDTQSVDITFRVCMCKVSCTAHSHRNAREGSLGGGECPSCIHLARMPCMYSTSQESATVRMKLGVELCMSPYHPSHVSRPTVLFHLL